MLANNTRADYAAGESFFTVFGVFFSTATGVFSGINMSGDLRNPSHSIPIGTLSAVGVRYYCTFRVVSFSFTITCSVLLWYRLDTGRCLACKNIASVVVYILWNFFRPGPTWSIWSKIGQFNKMQNWNSHFCYCLMNYNIADSYCAAVYIARSMCWTKLYLEMCVIHTLVISVCGRFPDSHFPGQTFPGQTIPGQDVSRTRRFRDRRFPDRRFPDKTIPGQTFPGQYVFQAPFYSRWRRAR